MLRRLQALVGLGTVEIRPDSQVSAIRDNGQNFLLHCTSPRGGGIRTEVRAGRLILATGAYDRQLPIPGWDLPGVFSAGGVQALLKSSGTVPGRRLLVAGTGIFLLPVAVQAAAAGTRVVGICEANSPTAWLRHWHSALLPRKILEGAGYFFSLLRYRIALRPRRVITAILGDERVEAVLTARVDADGRPVPVTQQRSRVDAVALGWGFTPQLELPVSLGLQTRVAEDGSLVVAVDAQQRTSHERVWAAGESTGVGGVDLALAEGLAAGRAIAGLPRTSPRTINRYRRFATALHATAPLPQQWQQWLQPDTVVCRCEEVTVAELREAADRLRADDPRTAKGLTRAGMGWCQGRICGTAVACLSGPGNDGTGVENLRQINNRPLAAPVPLAELAGWDAPG